MNISSQLTTLDLDAGRRLYIKVLFNSNLLLEIAANLCRKDILALSLSHSRLSPAVRLLWSRLSIISASDLDHLLSILACAAEPCPKGPWWRARLRYGWFVRDLSLKQDYECAMIRDTQLIELFSRLPNLHALQTEDITLPGSVLASLAKHTYDIRTLHLYAPAINTPSLHALATSNPNLTQLTLTTDLPQHTITHLSNTLHSLTTLTLQGDPASRVPPTRLLLTNPTLRTLSLSNLPLPDSTLHAISKLTNLTSLTLTNPTHLPPPALRETLDLLGPTLTSLSLTSIPTFGSDDLAKLVESCPNLEQVRLLDCGNISAESVKAFVIATKVRFMVLTGDVWWEALSAFGKVKRTNEEVVFERVIGKRRGKCDGVYLEKEEP